MAAVSLPPLNRKQHAGHFMFCLRGLAEKFTEVDTSRVTLAFYCLSGLDLLGALGSKTTEEDRTTWREWIWRQQLSGKYGAGFRPGPSLAIPSVVNDYDQPHLINTYTAILSLCILRDDLTRLDRQGIISFLRSTQQDDGSFTPIPNWGEADVRLVYCAFIIAFLLQDWSGIDVEKSLRFIRSCRTYEGGYGQGPNQEAQGGTTYCSVAVLALAPAQHQPALSSDEKEATVRWLLQCQTGGFQGRTEKTQDACYSFWCGAAIEVLGAGSLVDVNANAAFLGDCQFRFGGIAKFPNETPDPFHTYMALASLSLYPPSPSEDSSELRSWQFGKMDALVNAQEKTAEWAIANVPTSNDIPTM
ncbi:hypothetical protein FRB99_002510 [Tulasnella sp. 403]|nr:hypothetical protein FRB99_002510 [Tulasnella sp. 403]